MLMMASTHPIFPTVDGFFVAKFKVNKKTKAQKASGRPAAEVEMEVDGDAAAGGDGDASGIAKFSNAEDEALIRGSSPPVTPPKPQLTTACPIDSKRQALKARGIKLAAPAADSPAAKASATTPATDSPSVPKKMPKEKSRPRPVAAAPAAVAAGKSKKVANTTAA